MTGSDRDETTHFGNKHCLPAASQQLHQFREREYEKDIEQEDMANIIEAPTTTDILFGRDSDSWNHEGNRRFRIVVAKYQDEYHSTNARAKKVAIVAKIVEELKSGGCRFLKKNPQNSKWFEVDRKAAVEKVGR